MSATTPRRTQMPPVRDSPLSTPRCVLGDLTPRAMNTPPKQTTAREALEAIRARSPLKQVQTLSPHLLVDKENASSIGALNASKKRSISEVDGVHHSDRGETLYRGRELEYLPTETQTMAEIVDMDFHEDERVVVSRGSTTEPDSPQPEALEEHIDNSQASNQSFSAFLNLDACASQPMEEQPPPLPLAPPVVEQETEKKVSRADLLRLRLGLANYKVKTNQIDKTGSEVISTWETSTSNSLNASASSNTTKNSSEISNPAIPSNSLSPVRRNNANHIKINLDPGRPIPKLSGGPQLLPTSVSSRMIYDYHMPSSPPDLLPQCVSPAQVMSPTRPDYRTPVAKRMREEGEDETENFEDETIEERIQRQRAKRFELGDMTSSAVKKDVAHGLMELSSGRR